MINQEPQKVIVYRNKAEQMQDDYLWGDGLFTPIGATDILVILIVVAGVIMFSSRKKRY